MLRQKIIENGFFEEMRDPYLLLGSEVDLIQREVLGTDSKEPSDTPSGKILFHTSVDLQQNAISLEASINLITRLVTHASQHIHHQPITIAFIVNTGNHFVNVEITVNPNSSAKILMTDPKGTGPKLANNRALNAIQEGIRRSGIGNIQIEPIDYNQQQTDGSSCSFHALRRLFSLAGIKDQVTDDDFSKAKLAMAQILVAKQTKEGESVPSLQLEDNIIVREGYQTPGYLLYKDFVKTHASQDSAVRTSMNASLAKTSSLFILPERKKNLQTKTESVLAKASDLMKNEEVLTSLDSKVQSGEVKNQDCFEIIQYAAQCCSITDLDNVDIAKSTADATYSKHRFNAFSLSCDATNLLRRKEFDTEAKRGIAVDKIMNANTTTKTDEQRNNYKTLVVQTLFSPFEMKAKNPVEQNDRMLAIALQNEEIANFLKK